MSTARNLSIGQLKDLEAAIREENCALLDVRESREYSAGHIPLAASRPLSQIASWSEKMDPNRPVVVYCRTNNRSRRCAKLLCDRGFREVYILDGGYSAWSAAGAQDH
jgi:thiosulfate sulfurtransferase